MMALGEVPHPLTGKTELRLPEAQHFIDMLAMLEEKTAGHRTADESELLDGFLHQLRLAYVELQRSRTRPDLLQPNEPCHRNLPRT